MVIRRLLLPPPVGDGGGKAFSAGFHGMVRRAWPLSGRVQERVLRQRHFIAACSAGNGPAPQLGERSEPLERVQKLLTDRSAQAGGSAARLGWRRTRMDRSARGEKAEVVLCDWREAVRNVVLELGPG